MVNFLVKNKSRIDGIGIFTTKEIGINSVFYQVPVESILGQPKFRCAYIGRGRWVSDENVLNYVNHSCDANSILDVSSLPKLVAKKKINVGEEITVDYNKTEKNGTEVRCNCKTKKCRNFFFRVE